MVKKRKAYMISPNLDNQITTYAKENNISQSELVSQAVSYFFKHEGKDFPELVKVFDLVFKHSAKDIVENLESLKEEQKRIRFALNDVSKNNSMQNEFWNDYHIKNGETNIVTTNIKKSVSYGQVESLVTNKILDKQQNKHS